jgi:hypothetical protein
MFFEHADHGSDVTMALTGTARVQDIGPQIPAQA